MNNKDLIIPQQQLDKMAAHLSEAMMIQNPIFGTVQIYNPLTKYLHLVLQNKETDFFNAHLINVDTTGNSVCSRALRQANQIMIADIKGDSFFSEIIEIGFKLDFKALHCTPIFGSHREVIGILTTHFDNNLVLTDLEILNKDLIAAKLALSIQESTAIHS